MPSFTPLRGAAPALQFALLSATALAVASCSEPAPPAASRSHAVIVPAQPADVFERDAHSMIGISYPPGLARYPGLAQRLVEHARARRALVIRTLARMPNPPAPFELSLRFVTVADTPHLFAISAEEELYLGGATSHPGSSTFLWLPSEQRLLSAGEVIPDSTTWAQVHAYVRMRRQEESALRIDDIPSRAMRHDFAPRMNSAGRIVGLRFRSEDGSEVEVPAAMLKRRVSPAYATWFDDTPSQESAPPKG